jgi:hypothetical protein
MLYETSRPWVIGYTLWNWTFIYLNYPFLVGHQTAVLAAALMIGMLSPRHWAQTRAATLGLSLLFSATYLDQMVSWLDGTSWFNHQVATLAAGLAFIFMAAYFLVVAKTQNGRTRPSRTVRQVLRSSFAPKNHWVFH